MPTTLQTNIVLSGTTDPSVARTFAQGAQLLKQMQSQMKALGVSGITTTNQINKLAPSLSHANSQVNILQQGFTRLSTIVSGVAIGEGLVDGLKEAVGVFEELINKAKEFGIESIKVRATREILQNQQSALFQSLGRGGLSKQVDAMLRNFEGREGIERYEYLMEATNRIVTSNPARFQNVNQIHQMLGILADWL